MDDLAIDDLAINELPINGLAIDGLPMDNGSPADHKKSDGYTLIEILIVVAIMGLLMAIALPAYQDSVLRSGRSQGRSVIVQVASDQERFFNNNNSYSTNAQPLADPAVATRESDDGLWLVTVAACGTGTIANCFVATATAQNEQLDDTCDTITITDTGRRGATGDTVDECWNR